MRKVRDWPRQPSEGIARVSLKLLIDGEAPDEPQWLVDQTRAWLQEVGFGESSSPERSDGLQDGQENLR